jgi:hypothetical protein
MKHVCVTLALGGTLLSGIRDLSCIDAHSVIYVYTYYVEFLAFRVATRSRVCVRVYLIECD